MPEMEMSKLYSTDSLVMFLLAKEKLGLESTGHEAGSADALVPIILQCKILNPCHEVFY